MRIRKTPVLNIKIDVVDRIDSADNRSFEVHSMNKMWTNVKKILSEDEACSKKILCYQDENLIKEFTRKPLNEGKKFSWYIHNAVKATNRRIQEKMKRLQETHENEIPLSQPAAQADNSKQEKKAKVLVG